MLIKYYTTDGAAPIRLSFDESGDFIESHYFYYATNEWVKQRGYPFYFIMKHIRRYGYRETSIENVFVDLL